MKNNILKFIDLLKENSNYKPASYYAKSLNLSTKTIYKYIDEINSLNDKSHLFIDKKPSLGIVLNDNSNIDLSINKFFSHNDYLDIESRRIYLIKMLIGNSYKTTITDISDKFYISKSSIYNDIKNFNYYIRKFDVEIFVQNDFLEIKGSETLIQSALKYLIYNVIYKYKVSIDEVQRELLSNRANLFLKDIIDFINSIENINIPNYYYDSFYISTAIFYDRRSCGHKVQYLDEIIDLDKNIEYKIKSLLVSNFSCVNSCEIKYLINLIYTHGLYKYSYKDNLIDVSLTKEIISKVSKDINSDLTNNQVLISSLKYHLPLMVSRLQNDIYIYFKLLEDIKNEYFSLYKIVWNALELIENTYKVTLNGNEVSLVLLHFLIAIEKQNNFKKIIILCQYGMVFSQIILEKVKKFLPKDCEIIVKNLEDIKNNKVVADMIISSIDYHDPDIPVVKVSPTITTEDYINIITTYNKFDLLDSRKNSFASINKYLREDLIYTNFKVDSKEDFIIKAFEILRKKDLVYDDFKNSILDREKHGRTFFETGIALPHANSKTIKKSNISIFTLNKDIKRNEGCVKVIILFNFIEKDNDDFKNCINEIYNIIFSFEEIKKLRNKSVKEILEYFKEGNNNERN